MVDLTDSQLNNRIVEEQQRLENSGLSSIRVKISNPIVKSAIVRLYNIDERLANEIDFALFSRAVRDLARLGMYKSIEGLVK